MTYTIVISNSGPAMQTDNPDDEFVDVLSAQLTLISATATSGAALATIGTNTVTWNGAIPAGGSVTITIQALIEANVPAGTTITNQGTINYDADGNGTNEASAVTDDPALGGSGDTSGFVVAAQIAAIPALDGFAPDEAARWFEKLGYMQVLNKHLEVMDRTAITLCMENNLPIVVFDLLREGNIERVVRGETVGTLITGD